MKKIKYILFIVVVTFASIAKAQQDPMYTQYMNNLLSINPAYAGSKGVLSTTLIYRSQWTNFEGNPTTSTFFIHAPIKDQAMGLGFSFVNDKIGYENNNGFFADYSYSLYFSRDRSLAFGLKAGVSIFGAQLSKLNIVDETGPIQDPALIDIQNKLLPNVGVGLYYSTTKSYIGFSAPKLIMNKLTTASIETQYAGREQIHLFFMGGYVFDISRILKFKPYFMTKVVPNAPISADLSGQFLFFDKFGLGGTYRIGDSFGVTLYIVINDQFKIGSSYDFTANELSSYSPGGTIEFMINFDMQFGRGKVRSPRYF